MRVREKFRTHRIGLKFDKRRLAGILCSIEPKLSMGWFLKFALEDNR